MRDRHLFSFNITIIESGHMATNCSYNVSETISLRYFLPVTVQGDRTVTRNRGIPIMDVEVVHSIWPRYFAPTSEPPLRLILLLMRGFHNNNPISCCHGNTLLCYFIFYFHACSTAPYLPALTFNISFKGIGIYVW